AQVKFAESEDWRRDFELVYARLLRSLGEADSFENEFAAISDLWSRPATSAQRDELVAQFREAISTSTDRKTRIMARLDSGALQGEERALAEAQLARLNERIALLERELERVLASPDLLEMDHQKLTTLIESQTATV